MSHGDMDKAYFRSYIRQYACSPEEIRNAFKYSPQSDKYEVDAILTENSIEEKHTKASHGFIATTHPPSSLGDEVFLGKPCPPERATYCYNGGTCYIEYIAGTTQSIEMCKCQPGWEGRQCQHMYNPQLYESARVAPEVESADVGSMITVIIIGLVIFSGILYLSKTLCKGHDLRDYMYSESAVDPRSMTPIQMYPFSRSLGASRTSQLVNNRSDDRIIVYKIDVDRTYSQRSRTLSYDSVFIAEEGTSTYSNSNVATSNSRNSCLDLSCK